MDNLDKLTLISNECWGVIDFNNLLPVGPLVTVLPVWHINHYSCHLWGTCLMYVEVVHHMDNASLMDNAKFLFFCYMMDEGDFSPLHWWWWLGLSTENRYPTHPKKQSDPARESADPTPVTVGGGSPPPEPRNRRVGWRVFPPKIRKTRTDRQKPIIRWETQIPARKTQIPALFDNSDEIWDAFLARSWLDPARFH